MKKLFAFLLACVCALALFGCAGANDDKSDGGPEDDWAPLTDAQIEEFKELFASTADVTDETTGEYRYTTSTPVSCFSPRITTIRAISTLRNFAVLSAQHHAGRRGRGGIPRCARHAGNRGCGEVQGAG